MLREFRNGSKLYTRIVGRGAHRHAGRTDLPQCQWALIPKKPSCTRKQKHCTRPIEQEQLGMLVTACAIDSYMLRGHFIPPAPTFPLGTLKHSQMHAQTISAATCRLTSHECVLTSHECVLTCSTRLFSSWISRASSFLSNCPATYQSTVAHKS